MTEARLRQPSHNATRNAAPPSSLPANRLHGRCPDLHKCALPIACCRWCWRLEQPQIQKDMGR